MGGVYLMNARIFGTRSRWRTRAWLRINDREQALRYRWMYIRVCGFQTDSTSPTATYYDQLKTRKWAEMEFRLASVMVYKIDWDGFSKIDGAWRHAGVERCDWTSIYLDTSFMEPLIGSITRRLWGGIGLNTLRKSCGVESNPSVGNLNTSQRYHWADV